MNFNDIENSSLFLSSQLTEDVIDENGEVVRTIRLPPLDWFDRNTESNRIDRVVFSFNHHSPAKRLEKDRVLVTAVSGNKLGAIYCTETRIELEKLLAIFNHLRDRCDRLIDTADESTLDEILSTDHFIVGEAEK